MTQGLPAMLACEPTPRSPSGDSSPECAIHPDDIDRTNIDSRTASIETEP